MKHLHLFGIMVVTLSVYAHAQAQAQKHTPVALSPEEVFRLASPSVFVVESLNSEGAVLAFGSGVAVRLPTSDLVVVTNKHVIYGAVAYRVCKGQQTWKASLVRLDQGHDLCALEPEAGWGAKAVPIRVSSEVKVGERSYAIGAPEGLELTLSEGLVSGLREIDNARVIQTSAPVSHGSSGGGLFDSQGRLIGVMTFSIKEGQNLNFALPGEWVLALGSESAARFPASASGSQLEEARKWADRGFSAYLEDRYREAIDCYKEAVRLDPEDHPSWYHLGEAQMKLRSYNEAIKSFQQATRLKSDDSLPWLMLALSYAMLKKYDDAIDAANQATEVEPENPNSWAALAAVYSAAGKCTEALDASEMLLLFPDDEKAQAYYNVVQTKCKSR
jgi:hypothetical protein